MFSNWNKGKNIFKNENELISETSKADKSYSNKAIGQGKKKKINFVKPEPFWIWNLTLFLRED